MPYLICPECDHYYEVEPGEEFEACECGQELIIVEELSEYYDVDEGVRESISTGNTFTEEMAEEYYSNKETGSMMIIGGVIAIFAGLFLGLLVSAFLFIISLLGLVIIIYALSSISQNELKGKGWAKGLVGENIVSDHLKELPENYFIYNDVNLPGKRGNIDHVVIGPNGIFVIETKHYSGKYLIKDKDWFVYTRDGYRKVKTNPAHQVIRNTMELKSFLETRGVDSSIWFQAIVAFKNSNFKVKEKPKAYRVLVPETVPKYILKQKRNYDIEILKQAALELEPYCVELSFVNK